MTTFSKFRRSQIAELAAWEPGFNMIDVSVSAEDAKAGSPKPGDMIARNPANHADQWLVASAYFAANFELAEDGKTNYANHPLSIAELRSDKTNSGADWTPRDALIAALRDIDSGVHSPTTAVVMFGNIDDAGNAGSPYFYQATRNRYEFLGLIEAVKVKINT